MYPLDSSTMSLVGFGAVVVVGAIVMYLISLFSMKETSFEDVLEEQRKKKAKEDKERSLQNKQKREQYKKKFDLKKKKAVGNGKVEKVDAGVSPMHEVQIKETPQMASGEPVQAVAEVKKTKGKPAKKQQEPPQPKEGSPKPSHPILKPTPEKPKQEPPTQQTVGEAKAEVQKKKQEAGRTRNVSFSDDVQEKQRVETDQEKSKKKKKKEAEVESEIVANLREATLTDRDVQHVLTMVKQKYGVDIGGGGKIKDLQLQLDNAKKQLSQSENNLQQYVTRCMAAENKIEQLKQDLMLEKTKLTSLEKSAQDAEANRKQEVAMIQSRHANEMKQLQEKIAMVTDYEEICKTAEKLKGEKTILMNEIQKNGAVVAENTRLSGDLKQAKHQVQESQLKVAELEAKLKEYSQQSESLQHQQDEKENRLLLEMREQANRLQQIQKEYSALDSEFKKVKTELQTTQSNSTKLLEQVTALTEDNDAKTETQRALEQRHAESEQLMAERDTQIQDVTKQNADLKAQVLNLEQQIAQLKSQIVKIDRETKDQASADAQTTQEKEEIKKLYEELDAFKKEKETSKAELDKITKKNNDLRERSRKAMDALSNMEKTLLEKVAAAKAEGEVRCAQLESSVKQSLSDAFPQISISEKDFESWIKVFAVKINETSQTVQSNEPSHELEEAREEMSKLRSRLEKSSSETSKLQTRIDSLESSVKSSRQEKESLENDSRTKQEELLKAYADCEKYKNVLNSTEEVLCKLQSSVEVEEGVWKKKVEEAHNEASKAHQDAEDLRKTIEELKLDKSHLQGEVNESEELKKRLNEMTQEVSELKEQLSAKEATTNADNGTAEDERLEKEKSLTKNLGQAATKLQSVLKQTQEQLNEEREKNVDLEKKLASENDVKDTSQTAINDDNDAADGTCV